MTQEETNETSKENTEEEKQKSERVKLDEILKSLFTVSNKVLVNMMNSLFKENFDAEVTKVSFGKNELDRFATDEHDIIRGDLFVEMLTEETSQHYHIELQTKNDKTMAIRMLEYGFSKAKELQKYENKDGKEIVLYIPKQLVIFIEQNRNIENELKMKLVFPDGQEVKYNIPVMKYWEYDDKELIEQKMYPLLPLQAFKLRYSLDKLKAKRENKQKQIDLVYEAKEIAKIIGKEARDLFDNKEITGDDLHKILLANTDIFEYLNNKYTQLEKLNEEVLDNMRTLYDPEVEKRGEAKGEMKKAIKAATNLLKRGIDPQIIAEDMELSLDKVLEIKQQLQKELVHS